MNKLMINLSPQEVKILTHILELILTGTDMERLKKHLLEHYLMFSCVHDLYNRLDTKTKEIQAFGYTTGKPVKITLKRYEALAFFMLCDESAPDQDSYLPAVPDTTISMIRSIRGDIHKHFLV